MWTRAKQWWRKNNIGEYLWVAVAILTLFNIDYFWDVA